MERINLGFRVSAWPKRLRLRNRVDKTLRKPVEIDDGEERSVTYEELRERLRRKIEELRGGLNAAGLDKGKKRKNEKNDRKGNVQKKQKRDGGAGWCRPSRTTKRRKELLKFKELENVMRLEEAKKDPKKGEVIAKKHSWKAIADDKEKKRTFEVQGA
ncbi:hypothetical protein V6N13_060729 [Hibiscus sabdariffa]